MHGDAVATLYHGACDALLALVAFHGEKNLLQQPRNDAGIVDWADHAVSLAGARLAVSEHTDVVACNSSEDWLMASCGGGDVLR